jgi:DNA-binding response OmpR family regulator
MHVLLADDDKVQNLLLSTFLKQKGVKVTIAQDAMQAVMYALRFLPDAIVLDVYMPGGTGVEAIKKLKSSTKTTHIPILVLSGAREPSDREKMLNLGAADFIEKPAEPEVVHDVLLGIVKPPR